MTSELRGCRIRSATASPCTPHSPQHGSGCRQDRRPGRTTSDGNIFENDPPPHPPPSLRQRSGEGKPESRFGFLCSQRGRGRVWRQKKPKGGPGRSLTLNGRGIFRARSAKVTHAVTFAGRAADAP